MNNSIRKPNPPILSILFYVLAGIMALATLAILWGVISLPGVMDQLNGTAGMLGLGPIASMVLGPIRGVLVNAGVIGLVLMGGMAGLLFGFGRLIARQSDLMERVAQLEEEVRVLKG